MPVGKKFIAILTLLAIFFAAITIISANENRQAKPLGPPSTDGVDGIQSITTLYTFDGETAYDNLGESVSNAGDVNNDGYDDLIVGAPDGNGGTGRAYVFSGFDGVTLWIFDGEAEGDKYGHSVSGAGDANGDGYDDLVIGACWHDGPEGNRSGKAYVYSGFNGNLLFDFDGETANDEFGISVASAGDVNNDGFDDVIIGASGYNGSKGKAYVFQV